MLTQSTTDRLLTDVCDDLGITVRQADYWIRRGYLDVVGQGSGKTRSISPDEAQVLGVMARLVRAGVRWEDAADLARRIPEGGTITMEDIGVVLTVQP